MGQGIMMQLLQLMRRVRMHCQAPAALLSSLQYAHVTKERLTCMPYSFNHHDFPFMHFVHVGVDPMLLEKIHPDRHSKPDIARSICTFLMKH